MFDLSRLEKAIEAETPQEQLFVKYCREYGLEPELLHKSIIRKNDNKKFVITGLFKRGKAAWILIKHYAEYSQGVIRDPLLIDIRKFHKLYYF